MQNNHITTYATTVNATISKVWQALTDPVYVEKYMFGAKLETTWQVGNPISWSGEFQGQSYHDKGVVLEFEPEKKLKYSYLTSWVNMEDLPKNYLFVAYSVKEKNGATELSITQSNYDEEKAEHTNQNWEIVVNELKKLIE